MQYYNWWISVNSVKRPDKLHMGALQIVENAHVDCMVIAFLTMEGVDAEAEMEASLEVIDVL